MALANIDPVIALIKASPNAAQAREKLLAQSWEPGDVIRLLERAGEGQISRPDSLPAEFGFRDGQYYFSPEQAKAILDMQLHRLTGLEQEKLHKEYEEILERIKYYISILSDPDLLLKVIREELEEIRDNYGDDRRTEIITSRLDLSHEDLITEEDVVVTLSYGGYAKTQPIDTYEAQKRGGKGKAATKVKDEDYIDHLLVASTHDTILCFTSVGKVYWLRVFQLPQASRTSRGQPIVNILPLSEGERVTSILPLRDFSEGKYVFMATSNGTVKKVELNSFARPRSSGLIAIELEESNTLVGVAITDGSQELMLMSSEGKAIRFKEDDVRAMGRSARGVRGIKIKEGHKLISLLVVEDNCSVLTASANGYGKRTCLDDYSTQGRGGQGVIAMQISDRNGALVGAVKVVDGDEIMLISDQGKLIRTRANEVSVQGRNTQGVRLIRLADDEHLVGVERVEELVGDEVGGDGEDAADVVSADSTDASVGDSASNSSTDSAAESGTSDAGDDSVDGDEGVDSTED